MSGHIKCGKFLPSNERGERLGNLALFLPYLCCPKTMLTHLTIICCAIYTIKYICHIKLLQKNARVNGALLMNVYGLCPISLIACLRRKRSVAEQRALKTFYNLKQEGRNDGTLGGERTMRLWKNVYLSTNQLTAYTTYPITKWLKSTAKIDQKSLNNIYDYFPIFAMINIQVEVLLAGGANSGSPWMST